ncbi:unnamed protein product [Schistocephalus solidus]|uniref:Uncharacterized protein n=1 Tax=Schistocephalus solidus TaxID=70667 RepID=A0A183SF21_SCHSO|nr:unnamed protein product [Schistocephalus solidus]
MEKISEDWFSNLRGQPDMVKKSLKQLQINSATWEDLTQDITAWRRSMKTGSAIYEANRFAAAKAKIAERKSAAPGPKPPVPSPFKHFSDINAPSTRESVWSDIFVCNAPTIRQF